VQQQDSLVEIEQKNTSSSLHSLLDMEIEERTKADQQKFYYTERSHATKPMPTSSSSFFFFGMLALAGDFGVSLSFSLKMLLLGPADTRCPTRIGLLMVPMVLPSLR
jgi:hypothetical protein